MSAIGRFRHRVMLQTAAETKDAHGQVIVEWKFLAMRWARVTPLSGRERFVTAQELSEITHQITFRYDKLVGQMTPKSRIVLEDRVFDVLSITNRGERERYIDAVAREVI